MKLSLLIVVLSLFAYVLSFEDYTIQYSRLPSNKLGSLEGFYTSNTHLGKGLYICEEENVIFGSFDELGIIQANYNSTEGVASGNFYKAGTGPCTFGTVEMRYTSDGFVGLMSCDGVTFEFNEYRMSSFRPSDLQCAIMDLSSVSSIRGRYIDENGLFKDICHAPEKATASFLYLQNGVEIQGYFEGLTHENGKILTGTWYDETPSAGADLYYLDAEGVVRTFFWTGLNGTTGETVINPSQYRNPTLHGSEAFFGPVSQTGTPDCSDYAKIKEVVVAGLVPNDDDDFYYFITSNFNYIPDDGEPTYVSSAVKIVWAVIPLLLALFL